MVIVRQDGSQLDSLVSTWITQLTKSISFIFWPFMLSQERNDILIRLHQSWNVKIHAIGWESVGILLWLVHDNNSVISTWCSSSQIESVMNIPCIHFAAVFLLDLRNVIRKVLRNLRINLDTCANNRTGNGIGIVTIITIWSSWLSVDSPKFVCICDWFGIRVHVILRIYRRWWHIHNGSKWMDLNQTYFVGWSRLDRLSAILNDNWSGKNIRISFLRRSQNSVLSLTAIFSFAVIMYTLLP
jgi:hypothetical protein